MVEAAMVLMLGLMETNHVIVEMINERFHDIIKTVTLADHLLTEDRLVMGARRMEIRRKTNPLWLVHVCIYRSLGEYFVLNNFHV